MNKCRLTFILLCYTALCGAKDSTVTFSSANDGSITITYGIEYKKEEVDISFKKINKKKDIEVVFFDQIGVLKDRTRFTGNIELKPLELPSNLSYDGSESNEYFLLSRKPKLSFNLLGEDETNLSIPMYIVKKKKEKEYQLLEELGELKIKLCKPKEKKSIQHQKAIETTNLSIEKNAEDEEELRNKVNIDINSIKKSLEEQTKYPFSETLRSKIKSLGDYKKDVKGEELYTAIVECLDLCEKREKELQKEAEEQAKRAEEATKKQQEELQKKEKARQDSIKIAEQAQAEAEKKQNMWMIIGGAILAVLCFIGNQIFQHFRNLRSQRSMFEMQEDIARRAEYEAKRHTQNAVRKKTNEVVNNTKKATDKLVRDKVNKPKGNNSTKFSI